MEFVVDAWDPGYGSSTSDAGLSDSSRPVDASCEVPEAEWKVVNPDSGVAEPEAVTFVDGVRRIDARLWLKQSNDNDDNSRTQNEPNQFHELGICASVAAGSVRCTSTEAKIETVLVERGLHTAAKSADSIKLFPELGDIGTYELRQLDRHDEADSSPNELGQDEVIYLSVHNHMSELEHKLAKQLTEPGLVIFDGPLGRRDAPNGAGYIKTQHVQYLSPRLQPVVASLSPGQRTPIFQIGGAWSNWSWYMKLPSNGSQADHPMAGVVRIELPGLGDASCAAERADIITRVLPRFASESYKDSRAPQNLYPIGGLERELRHRLGDGRLIDRALRRSAA